MAKRALAPDMADDLLKRVGRKAGRGGGGADGIARGGMRLAKRGDGGFDLFRGEPDLRGKVLHVDIFGNLGEESVEHAHEVFLRLEGRPGPIMPPGAARDRARRIYVALEPKTAGRGCRS